MKVIVLAYHQIGVAGIQALIKNRCEILAVFTHRDDPEEARWFGSVAELAAALRIPVYAPEDINHPIWVERIRRLEPEMLFSLYYRHLIGPDLLAIPVKGCLNLHGSLLPRYRGRCPINWALVHGESETGVTLHYMTPRPDDGDICGRRAFPVSEDDTARTLHEKATAAAAELLDDLLPKLARGTAPRAPQDHSRASYFGGRKPEDGLIDWNRSAKEIRNLIRAVTLPYPGAFSYLGGRKYLFWDVIETQGPEAGRNPGAILSEDPFVIECGEGALRVNRGQSESGVCMDGEQMAREYNLKRGMTFQSSLHSRRKAQKPKVLILGVNGFIGSALSERLLESGAYEVHGMDLNDNYIQEFRHERDFYFQEGDISIHREWIEYHIRKCDVVLPLVAIATPIEYTRNPLRVFELDFEENLRIVRHCVKYGKRIVFPSTSEVYGMCEEDEFNEDHSKLVLGPIRNQRWIYSCSKQLLDRVIWAYGKQQGLNFTLFRPFNWIGPKLDSLDSARVGSSRAITQLILNLVEGTPMQLIDGGRQKRCFTDVGEGIECLFRIIENLENVCGGKIVNIGNPENEASIRELAEMLLAKFEAHPLRQRFPPCAGISEMESQVYYGAGYEDVQHRRPSIANARRLLNWKPVIGLEESVEATLDFFLKDAVNGLPAAHQNSSEADSNSCPPIVLGA